MVQVPGKRMIVCALFFVFWTYCVNATSQSAEQLPPLQRIYLGLTQQFASSPDTVLILLDPGITMDAWVDPNSAQIQQRLSELANEGLKPQPIRAVNSVRLAPLYEHILREGLWGQLILDRTQQQQMADADKILYKDSIHKTPTAGYAQYLQLKDRYTKAQATWDSTPEDKRTEIMRAELDAAIRDLELRGNAALYQGALETLDAIAGMQPSTLRDRWIAQLEGSTSVTSDGTRAFPAEFIPPVTFDYSSRWTAIAIDSTLINSAHSITPLTWPRAIADPWRFCNSSAFTDGDDRQVTSAVSFAVSLEAKTLAVSRPWIDEALFAHKGWKAKDASMIISSGDSPLNGHANGAFPIIVTHIILARNIAVDGRFSQDERSKVANQRQAGKCTSFGPFVVTGKTDFGNGAVPSFPFGDGFYLPGIQVIALIAKKVIKSPDPDSSHYRWP